MPRVNRALEHATTLQSSSFGSLSGYRILPVCHRTLVFQVRQMGGG